MVLVAFLLVFLLWIIYNRCSVITAIRQIRLEIPSDQSLPIFGHYHKFFGLNSEEAFVATNQFSSCSRDVSKLWQFHHLNICINSPELIEKVLMSKSCLQRPLILLKFFDINEGLLSSRYDQWVADRRFMHQYFTPKIIGSYATLFAKCADLMVEAIENHSDNDTDCDLLPHLEKCAVQGVCATLFGMDFMDTRIDQIYAKTSEIFETNTKTFELGLKNPLRFLEFIHKRSSNYKKVKSAQNFLTELLMKMKFDEGCDESLLGVLVKNEDGKYTEKQIREHILTYLNAGLDTTAAHVNYTILFLSMHPEYQKKLSQEIKSSTLSSDFDLDSILKMEYLDRVVKESFRLAPPIFLIGRETIEDFEIQPNCVIPRNTSMTINTFVLHRRKDLYGENSDKFNPNNFSVENVARRHPYSFQPFSTGRRNCIGNRFAIIFIKIVLASLIRNFEFTTDSRFEDLRFKYGMTLKLTKAHKVSIRKRV